MKFLTVSFLMLFLMGCASLRDTHQHLPLACNTADCQVQIKQTGQVLQAPLVIEIERQRQVDLTFLTGSETQTQKIEAQVRWTESVLPNVLLSLIGPAGWMASVAGLSIDWMTGNIWELPAPTVAKFKDASSAPKIDHIIIAPVQAPTQLDSEEAVAQVLTYLRKTFPKAKIEVPESYLHEFSEANWDHDGWPKENWKRYELYAKLPSAQLAVAKVIVPTSDTSSEGQIRIEIRDVLRQKDLHEGSMSFTVSSQKAYVGSWIKSQLLGMAPNAVSLRTANTISSGMAFEENNNKSEENLFQTKYYTLSSSPQSYKPSTEWGLTLTNVEPTLGRRFAFISKIATEGSLRKSSLYVNEKSYLATYTLTNFSSSSQEKSLGQVHRYFLGGGLGPEIGIVGAFGYLYMNLIYSAEIAYFDLSTNSKDELEIYSPVKAGIGYKLRFTDHFQMGLEVSSRSLPAWVANKMVSKMSSEIVSGASTTEAAVALSLSYYFPEMKSAGSKGLKKIFASK